jgi:hypothetical protein
VLSYLAENKYKKSLYMIVDLKIADGAKISLVESKGRSVGAKFGVSPPPGGSPVGGEASMSSDGISTMSDSFIIPGKFVFAIWLRKCHYFRGIGIIKDDYYTKGVILADLHAPTDKESAEERLIAEPGDEGISGIMIGEVDTSDWIMEIDDDAVVTAVEDWEDGKGKDTSKCIMIGLM